MSLDIDTLFKQLQDISSGTHVQLRTPTGRPPTERTPEPYYPVIPALPPCEGATTLSILKGREPGASDLVYTQVSGKLE